MLVLSNEESFHRPLSMVGFFGGPLVVSDPKKRWCDCEVLLTISVLLTAPCKISLFNFCFVRTGEPRMPDAAVVLLKIQIV